MEAGCRLSDIPGIRSAASLALESFERYRKTGNPYRLHQITCYDLAAWMERVGLESLTEMFLKEKITGQVLSLLTEEEFLKLGIESLGERKLLMSLTRTTQLSDSEDDSGSDQSVSTPSVGIPTIERSTSTELPISPSFPLGSGSPPMGSPPYGSPLRKIWRLSKRGGSPNVT